MTLLRFFAYLLGVIVLALSKVLIPMAVYAVTKIYNLSDQTVTYLLGKGPPLVTALIFILFGLDLLLLPRELVLGTTVYGSDVNAQGVSDLESTRLATEKDEKTIRGARIFGGFFLAFGVVILYLTFTGHATARYGVDSWPPLPYP
jgi:uncharacterized protein YjeT (DUF2065 family)